MTKLSPAAQAVMDAFLDSAVDAGNYYATRSHQIAAVLRAVADEAVPDMDEPEWGACNEMHCDIELFTDHQRKRAAILAIATELKGQP